MRWVVLAVCLGAALPAFAKGSVTVRLDKNVLRTGEQTRMAVSISTDGGQVQGPPTIPAVDGLNIVPLNNSFSQQFSSINGQTQITLQYDYFFDVYAIKEGKYTIQGVKATLDSGEVTGNAVEVSVFPGAEPVPTRSPSLSTPQKENWHDVYILADVSQKEAYVGEEIILSYDLVFHQQFKQWFERTMFLRRDYAVMNEQRGALKDFLSETVNLKFEGEMNPVRLSGRKDLFFQKPLVRYILFPLKAGDYSCAPFENIEVMIPAYRGFSANLTAVPIQPEPVALKIKPLPEEGKPDIFNGAVGSFQLKVSADPTEITEGNTVTLSVTLEGLGNIKNAPSPVLPDLSHFDQFDPTRKEDVQVTPEGVRGRVDYSYVLIPHDVNANEIGPVRYAYFDPAEGKYKSLASAPIPLTIHPSSRTGPRTGLPAGQNRRVITRAGDDFRFIVTSPDAIATVYLPLYQSRRFRIFFWLPAVLLTAGLVIKKRNEFLAFHPALAKSKKAPRLARRFLADARRALQQENAAQVYACLGKAITDFIGHRWNVACGGMTGPELKDTLGRFGIEAECVESVVQTLSEFDGARFSGAGLTEEQMRADYAKTEQILGALMKQKR